MTPDFPMELVERDWLARWSLYAPERVALQCGDVKPGTGRRELTYREFYIQSLALAQALRERFDVRHGDRVACLARNELEYISLFFAVQRLGAILVPINFRFTSAEVEHIIADCDPRVVVAQSAFWTVVEALKDRVPLWRFDGPESLTWVAGLPVTEWSSFAASVWEEAVQASGAEDPCMILYTSGTTGFPKGAMISHRMIFWNSINTGLRLNLTQSDCVLTFLPLFHTGGWNVLTTPCLHRGARVILLRQFDSQRILELVETERVTILFGVPTTMDLLRRSPGFDRRDLSSVRYAIVGGEPMPLEWIQTWEERGVPIRQGYGLTEFGPNVFSLNEEHSRAKMGSIGFPNFYCEARVVDEAGQVLPADAVGELELRGPMAMSGYWRNPEATAEVFRDGWLRTGDLVRRDSEGFYFVVGRRKEMFISGGENVYPAEVEKVLRLMEGVREAAVIGVPDPRWGETGVAFLVMESGSEQDGERQMVPMDDIDQIRALCRKHLAKFKIPTEFVICSELPKTESGKVAKKALHEQWNRARRAAHECAPPVTQSEFHRLCSNGVETQPASS
ncbi:MAG: class I adenylate-forming enzyme family protein [Bdellovibrionales bacterium]